MDEVVHNDEAILHPFQNKCLYGIHAGQTFLSLTIFIKHISIFISSNKLIKKIDSTIYLITLIVYYKY